MQYPHVCACLREKHGSIYMGIELVIMRDVLFMGHGIDIGTKCSHPSTVGAQLTLADSAVPGASKA